MKINNEDLQAFINAYKEDFKQYISEEDAREMASNLLDLYELLARPLPSETEARAKRLSEEPDPSLPEA